MVLLKIKRPEGNIETVDVSKKFCGMTDILFDKIKEATKNAGRGECLSYEIIVEGTISDEKMAEYERDVEDQKYWKKYNRDMNEALTMNGETY